MSGGANRHVTDRSAMGTAVADIQSVADLAGLLRALRRRHARQRAESELTYRELAALTGWSASTIAEYFTGKTLPPTDKLDVLIGLLGASPTEKGAIATARDRVQEFQRRPKGAPDSQPEDMPVPRQLPAAVGNFVGRSAELAALNALVEQDPSPGTVVISAMSGTAGVGKTALAVYWAHRVADRFPDGQLYINLRGFDPSGDAVEPTTAVSGFLQALGVPPQRVPGDLQAQTGLYRSLLAGRRMLVLLDNARDAEQVRPLLPGSASCLVLVTSRAELSGLVAVHGARSLSLTPLPAADARDLLAGRIGGDRLAAEPAAVRHIVTRCAGLPLALAIVAARAAARPGFQLAVLADQLRTASRVLDVFAGTDPAIDLRAVFSWSYQALAPAAARMFRLLGLHAGPDVTATAAASLAAVEVGAASTLLADLAQANLLTEHVPGRYSFHDLLRSYAADLAQANDTEADRHAARTRIVEHYTHTARTADLRLRPQGDQRALPLVLPEPDRHTQPLDDDQQAMTWLVAERPVLLATLRQAAETGFDAHACHLAWALDTFLDRQGHWPDRLAVCATALHSASRLGDPTAQAVAHRFLAGAYTVLGQHAEAQAHLRQALAIYVDLDDLDGQAQTHQNLAALADRQRQPDEALDHAKRSLDLYRVIGHRRGHADALNAVGWCSAQAGDYGEALKYCREALALLQQLDDRAGEAATWDSLGYAHHHLGDYRQAIDCYEQALAMTRELGARYDEADVLAHLGDSHLAAGEDPQARAAWQRALDILVELDHPDAGPVRDRLAKLDAAPSTVPR